MAARHTGRRADPVLCGQRGGWCGQESGLSFIVRAVIPAGEATNSVTLHGLSFSSAARSFHVYRGANPAQMFRIASDTAASEHILRYRFGKAAWRAAGREFRSCQFLLAAGIATRVCRDAEREGLGGQQHTGDAGQPVSGNDGANHTGNGSRTGASGHFKRPRHLL